MLPLNASLRAVGEFGSSEHEYPSSLLGLAINPSLLHTLTFSVCGFTVPQAYQLGLMTVLNQVFY